MRTLGIDFGERRIGLAISDPEARFALPLEILERRDDRSAIRAILAVVEREGVARLVVGEPCNLDGSRGGAAQRARRFAERLGDAAKLPVEFVDESLTTVEAAARMREAGPRAKGKRLDALAAQILLQEALDRRRSAP